MVEFFFTRTCEPLPEKHNSILIYSQDGSLWYRTEQDGVLWAPNSLDAHRADRGFAGAPASFFVDAGGSLHMVVSGTKAGVPGFLYVAA